MCAGSLDYESIGIGTVSIALSMPLLYAGWLLLRRALVMRRMPLTPVSHISEGPVKVYGTVSAAGGTLTSPLSNRSCVYYQYSIQECKGDSSDYMTVKSDRSKLCFYLDDGTGRVLVNPEYAQMDLSPDYRFQSGLFKDPPANVMEILSESRIKHDGFMGLNKGMKFFEYCIEPGSKLYVIGTARPDPGGRGYSSGRDYSIGYEKKNVFYISDLPGNKVFRKAFSIAFSSFAIGLFTLLLGSFLLAGGFGML